MKGNEVEGKGLGYLLKKLRDLETEFKRRGTRPGWRCF